MSMLLFSVCLCSWIIDINADVSSKEIPKGVAEPNLLAIPGLHGLQGTAGLFEAGGGGGIGPPIDGQCQNQEALTNLLVYQYLSGSLPGGTQAGVPNLNGLSSDIPIQALLSSPIIHTPVTTTGTFISTSVTTTVIIAEPSTVYSTSTTSYVTTVTKTELNTIPVFFRGSRLRTTVTDTSTDVITATEYSTVSIVSTSSVVQALPVHITYTSTQTKGRDGRFTLLSVTPGATSVIPEPIITAIPNVNNIDLSNLGLSQIDLASIASPNSKDNNVIDALASLLQQYSDEPNTTPRPSLSSRFKGSNPFSKKPNRFQQKSFATDRFRSNRFSSPSIDYDNDPINDEIDSSKFDVIEGFRLSDTVPKNIPSGTAATSTRYSKFHKKPTPVNNGLEAVNENDRENERFSASTSRKTLSRANQGKSNSRPSSSRFQAAQESNYFENDRKKQRSTGKRPNRQVSSSRRRPSRRRPRQNNLATPVPQGKQTVLTMYVSGTVPGQYLTSYKTLSLQSFASSRFKREVVSPTPTFISVETIKPIKSPEVVQLLKQLDKSSVKGMLKSMRKWVDYYEHEVLDEEVEAESEPETTQPDTVELSSSKSAHDSTDIISYESNLDTSILLNTPTVINYTPSVTEMTDLCPAPSTFTETVYHTVYLPNEK